MLRKRNSDIAGALEGSSRSERGRLSASVEPNDLQNPISERIAMPEIVERVGIFHLDSRIATMVALSMTISQTSRAT